MIVWFTETGLGYVTWLGSGSVILMLVGGMGAVSARQGIFNSQKVGLGFFFSCLSLFAWLMVANDNLATEFGIVSSYLAFIMIYRSLDFIFKDSNLIFEIDWDAKNRIPVNDENLGHRSINMLKTLWRSKDSTKTVLLTYTVQELSKACNSSRYFWNTVGREV